MKVLVLNSDQNPLNFISWKRAINLILKDKAIAIEYYDIIIHETMKKPKVIKLKQFISHIYKKKQGYSKKDIFIRDDFQCQYCGIYLNKHECTVDHIVPISRGGKSTYTNCVCACRDCNTKKGDKLLSETNFRLLKTPTIPSFYSLMKNKVKIYLTNK